MADKQPYEIARETVKTLNTRKLQPTPDNYQAIYHEIAGTKRLQPFPEEQMQVIVKSLPAKTPGQQRLQAQVDHAVRHHNWAGVQQALVGYTQLAPTPRTAADLAHAPHAALTDLPADFAQSSFRPSAFAPSRLPDLDGIAITPEVKEQLIRLIEQALPSLGVDDVTLAEQGKQLLVQFRQTSPNMGTLKSALANFNFKVSFAAEEQNTIKATLLELLQLVFQNIAELSLDERWLKGQMDALVSATVPPLTLRRLEDVRIRLKDVIYKQMEAKAQTVAAQEDMKRVLSAFIDRLSNMTEASSSFRGKIEQCAQQIEGATTLTEIAPILQEAVTAARAMSLDTQRAGDELREMREKTAETEARLSQLQTDLDRASAQARHDPLTGALNRKGLDEAVQREIANTKRKGVNLCVALLDIDNFKKLNDVHGHKTGDDALVHLTKVTRESIRPQDTLGRYGGEEFVVVMPDTDTAQGIEIMTRVQRELTRHFFLAGAEKILITFSAGVAQFAADESGASAVTRADQAMYLAKRSGKNRVLGA